MQLTNKSRTAHDNEDRNPYLEQYFMKKALDVAKKALDIGEVPVGCVIVSRKGLFDDDGGSGGSDDCSSRQEQNQQQKLQQPRQKEAVGNNSMQSNKECIIQLNNNNENGNKGAKEEVIEKLFQAYLSSSQVIISHGANQVNATRDATRHSECIAIDRMLTGGMTSDKIRLPHKVFLKNMKKIKTDESETESGNVDIIGNNDDKWFNVPNNPSHWKNTYGWGSGRLYKREIFKDCDLYVTCEPCIMVSLPFHYIANTTT